MKNCDISYIRTAKIHTFLHVFIVCLNLYCRWRYNYQDGVGIPLTSVTPPPHFDTCS